MCRYPVGEGAKRVTTGLSGTKCRYCAIPFTASITPSGHLTSTQLFFGGGTVLLGAVALPLCALLSARGTVRDGTSPPITWLWPRFFAKAWGKGMSTMNGKKTSLIDFPQSQLKNDVEHPFSPSSTSPIISTRNHDTHSHLQSQLSQIPQIHRVAHGVKSAPGRVLRRGAGSMERGSITLLGLVEFPKVQELRLKSVADIEDICGLITIQYP